MHVIFTTDLEARKQKLHDQIDRLQQSINELISLREVDWNIVKLYQERQNLLIVELYDLELE